MTMYENEGEAVRCEICDSRIQAIGPGRAWCPNCHQEVQVPKPRAIA